MMRLFGSQTSPYVRKVRVAALELGLDLDFVVVDAWSADNGVAVHNPLGKVPVLEIDGTVLFESTLIVEYLDNRCGDVLIPAGAERWPVRRCSALAHGLVDAVSARTLENRRSAGQISPAVLAREEARVARALDALEAVAGTRTVGSFSLADLTFGIAGSYVDFRYPHDWRAGRPRLSEWIEALVNRPSFRATMPPSVP